MSRPNDSMEGREARFGRNEAVFRAVNDAIEGLNTSFAAVSDENLAIVCECGEMSCVEQIPILTAEYARVRNDPTLFLVVPGHNDPAVEAVVENDHGAYAVVRKPPGTPAERAANSGP